MAAAAASSPAEPPEPPEFASRGPDSLTLRTRAFWGGTPSTHPGREDAVAMLKKVARAKGGNKAVATPTSKGA